MEYVLFNCDSADGFFRSGAHAHRVRPPMAEGIRGLAILAHACPVEFFAPIDEDESATEIVIAYDCPTDTEYLLFSPISSAADTFQCENCECMHDTRYDAGETVRQNDGRYRRHAHSQEWCARCAEDSETCADCSDRFNDLSSRNSDGGYICECCAEHYYSCENCGCILHSDDTFCREDYCETLCEGCYCELDRGNDDDVASYHCDDIREEWDAPAAESWGFEIEIDSDDRESVRDIAHEWEWAAETDSSLDDDTGLELISPPMVYSEMERAIRKMFPRIGRTDGAQGWNAGSEYGIHISCDSRSMTRLQLSRYVKFIENNPCGLCEFVAGRATHYAAYHPEKMEQTVRESLESTGKYSAVNISRLPRVEVRIFRSTLNVESAVANLQFLHAVREFCKAGYPQSDKALVRAFLKFIENNPDTYRELRRKMARFARSEKRSKGHETLCEMFPKTWRTLGAREALAEV